LFLLFAGSGCSALAYEIVWFQLLQFVVGSTAVSIGVLLGTFMGGMCLGSLALPRLLSARLHPLRVYAALELAIGALGIAVLFGMPHVDRLYTDLAGRGLPGFLPRGIVCGVCLLPPTLLMGATLPAIARWVETTPQGVSWLGFFYGGNIAGAVIGCLAAGFYFLRVHDMATTIYFAASLNLSVALISLCLSLLAPHRGATARAEVGARIRSLALPATDAVPATEPGAWLVYLTIALSGAGALGAEVVWTRLLSLLIGATVYTFSIILAVFLVGLGLGSVAGSMLAREGVRPRLALFWCQLLLTAALAWTAWIVTTSLPYWPINPYLAHDPWHGFQLDLLRCFWAILPATCLWGASFPLALAAVATRGRDAGRLVGGVYAANTVGAIAGALLSSLFLIRWAGTQHAQRALIGLAGLAALCSFAAHFWRPRAADAGDTPLVRPRLRFALLAAALLPAIGLPILLAWKVPETPWRLVAFGRTLPTKTGVWKVLHMGEGLNSSVVVTEVDGVRNFHVSGKVEASNDSEDMRLQRLLGHLPALIHPKPRSVLIVGCGAGVTAGSFVVHPDIERIVICEIEPLVPQVVAQFFAKENHHVLDDPRLELVYDDARHYILTTQEKFDIITSDPIHPWVRGSAALYTTEYFELCKRRLNPGGVVTQWVPLYESSRDVVKSEFATFFQAFPHGTVWSNDKNGEGYDVVLMGQAEPTVIDPDALQRQLELPNHKAVAQSMSEVGLPTTLAMCGRYAGRADALEEWLKGAEINHDRNLRLQYLAGLSLNADEGRSIYNEILMYRTFPEGLLVGKGPFSVGLRWMIKPRPFDVLSDWD
jgi:spermidine synthase